MMNISRKDLAVAIHLLYGLLAHVNQTCFKTLSGIFFFMVEAEGCGFRPTLCKVGTWDESKNYMFIRIDI